MDGFNLTPSLHSFATAADTSSGDDWNRPEERYHPHMVRSHKYGGALMTQEQFKALETIPQVIADMAALSGPCRTRAALVLANRIRVRCQLRGGADVPADLAVETLALLRELRAEADRHMAGGKKPDMAFIDRMYGGGEPWTPAIVRRLNRLAREVPERPDWRALQAEIMPDKTVEKAPAAAARQASPTPAAHAQPAPDNLSEASAVLGLLHAHVSTGQLQPDLILAGINAARAAITRASQGSITA